VQDVIRQLTSGRRLRISVLGQKEEAAAVLKALPTIQEVALVNGAIEAQYDGDDAAAAGILQALTAAGIKVSAFSQLEGGLEDAFMKATSEDV
jgi:ABC-type uncharacterized transport system ATPase subunit